MAAMGDPAQVGREMAKQYPRGWNVVTGVSLVLCVFVMFSALSSSSNRKMIGYAWDSLVYRMFPPGPETVIAGTVSPQGIEPVSGVTEAVDIRRTIGDNVLRVYQITVGTQDSQTAAKTRIYEGGYQDGALAAEAASMSAAEDSCPPSTGFPRSPAGELWRRCQTAPPLSSPPPASPRSAEEEELSPGPAPALPTAALPLPAPETGIMWA